MQINSSILTGRLVADAVLRDKKDGQFSTFTIASQRSYGNAQGEREADFIDCVDWRKCSAKLAPHLKKGMLIGVEGRITTRIVDGQNGKYKVTEISVERISFGENKKTTESGNQQTSNQTQATSGNSSFIDPFAGAEEISIGMEDLPFYTK